MSPDRASITYVTGVRIELDGEVHILLPGDCSWAEVTEVTPVSKTLDTLVRKLEMAGVIG